MSTWHSLASGKVKSHVLIGFIVLVFFLGGGSRHDIASLVVLRPLSFSFAIYALLVARVGELSTVRVPLMLLTALAVWMAAQLVPLPPAVWQQLPGRELFAEIYATAGMEGCGFRLPIPLRAR